jgi:hypothetical protein
MGSGELSAVDVDTKIRGFNPLTKLEGIDLYQFSTIMGIIRFLGDKEAVKKLNTDNDPNFGEQCYVLHMILWNVYMSVFRDEYFKRNSELAKKYAEVVYNKNIGVN